VTSVDERHDVEGAAGTMWPAGHWIVWRTTSFTPGEVGCQAIRRPQYSGRATAWFVPSAGDTAHGHRRKGTTNRAKAMTIRVASGEGGRYEDDNEGTTAMLPCRLRTKPQRASRSTRSAVVRLHRRGPRS